MWLSPPMRTFGARNRCPFGHACGNTSSIWPRLFVCRVNATPATLPRSTDMADTTVGTVKVNVEPDFEAFRAAMSMAGVRFGVCLLVVLVVLLVRH